MICEIAPSIPEALWRKERFGSGTVLQITTQNRQTKGSSQTIFYLTKKPEAQALRVFE
jgi:hypothetical protein